MFHENLDDERSSLIYTLIIKIFIFLFYLIKLIVKYFHKESLEESNTNNYFIR